MSLSAAPLTYDAPFEAAELIWHEWLTLWFTGANHSVGRSLLFFPQAALTVGQAALPQPVIEKGDVSIQILTLPESTRTRDWKADEDEIETRCTFDLIVRAAGGEVAGKTAAWRARRAADRLLLLLWNPDAALLLAERGIHGSRPAPPRPIADSLYQTRRVSVQTLLRWQSPHGIETPPTVLIEDLQVLHPTGPLAITFNFFWSPTGQAYTSVEVQKNINGAGWVAVTVGFTLLSDGAASYVSPQDAAAQGAGNNLYRLRYVDGAFTGPWSNEALAVDV